MADLGLAHRLRPDHAAFLAAWLKELKHTPPAIFTAAAKAQQAADWMHARQERREAAVFWLSGQMAELCAAMVGAHLAFAPGHIEDHAAIVQSWISVLRGDKRFILKASADARRGVDYLFAAGNAVRAA